MMKILELFSGYGTATFALKRLNIPHEIIGYSDIDKYANQCFKMNHGGPELGDCTKIDETKLPDFDLLTGGFPCQSFSVAGKGKGELDTRGTLFHEIIRIAEHKKPKYMLLENVKGLTNKNHRETFEKILSEIKRIGYSAKIKVLNSKEHGIPQNRERVWFVCFREIEDFKQFNWPEPVPLKIFLKDILEDTEEERYELNAKETAKLMEAFKRANAEPYENVGIMAGNFSRYKMKSPRNPNFEEWGVSWCINTSNNNAVLVRKKKVDLKYYLNDSQIKTLQRNFGAKGKILEITKDPSIIEKITYPSRINQVKDAKTSPTLTSSMGTGGGNVPCITNKSPRECKWFEDVSPALLSRDYKDPKVVGCALRTWPRNNKDAKNSPERGKRVEARKDQVSNAITTH